MDFIVSELLAVGTIQRHDELFHEEPLATDEVRLEEDSIG